MKRFCTACRHAGIKVGRVLFSGSFQCAYCGTEYEASRLKDLPHTVAGLLALVFVMAWFLNRLNGVVFLVLSGLWLAFDLVWQRTVPLRPVPHDEDGVTEGETASGDAPDERQ